MKDDILCLLITGAFIGLSIAGILYGAYRAVIAQ